MVSVPRSPLGRIIERHALARVDEALTDTRVVLINGARQSGKSTMAAHIARQRDAASFSLDRSVTLDAAHRDPTAFVRAANPMVIDEVQRAPELFLAIKEVVDSGFEPGRFLLTGSARILGLRGLPDTLLGRMETVELWPLSQGEIDDTPDGFVDAAFRDGPDLAHHSNETRSGYVHRLVRGGFPEAVARTGRRRARFHEAYIADLVNRDVMQLSAIEHGPELRRLITLLAGRSGQVIQTTNIANDVGLPRQTVERYLSLLEEVFLIKRLPYWSHGATARATRAPKLAFVDSGIAATILGYDETSLADVTTPRGGILEGFVAMEIARQATWARHSVDLFHYRTRDGVEVDIVLQDRRQRIIGIEVKAAATVRGADFRGLRHLQQRLGHDFVAGYVLYLGEQTLPFGDGLRAIPISALWQPA
ncbi:MAG: ATP-binding protein [Bifidobacteriaceae bacterium]|jgi:predicted AAA+ superfamily ATPase|nr:ATP-binding protein [Bifidobacteriaceae bacterium]